ncbi:PREDICTED: NF-kappa-B inhibitor-like protein 1 isoform X4 [Rhinopithecus bieti]|uniref:NF-kappa-B inhibitor-like protein 1 isoform X4 n=1 Tax=Rhinopithecus bieti TaxID=61621 RepID=UPI000533675D|nr:PREDICTED: NF-kappa-B inhibitor-like protein 1 isoform X4 [Rhinopithecus bieti]
MLGSPHHCTGPVPATMPLPCACCFGSGLTLPTRTAMGTRHCMLLPAKAQMVSSHLERTCSAAATFCGSYLLPVHLPTPLPASPAYTDFFLPLLSRCPSAMGIKNKDGETPGQILGWGPPWDSAEEEEEDDASKEREWRQKLQGELEDEWQEVMGRFEGDASHETQEPESFSAWSDRLAREHAQKCQQQQREAEGSCRPPRAEGSSQSWRQQEEEQRLFRERARAKEEELRESRARRAQEALGDREPKPARAGPRAEHPRGAGRGSLWRFGDVPWPCPGGGDPEAMAAALVARGPPLEEQGALRRYLRVQQVRWHPDRFLQRFRSQIETWELGRVMGAVTALSQALNRHAEALK